MKYTLAMFGTSIKTWLLGLSDTTVLAIYRDILLLTIVIPCLYITVIKNHLLCSTRLRILGNDKVHPSGFPCREV